MATLMETFEQQYAALTADITSKSSRIPNLPPDEKAAMVTEVERHLEEANELLEQMELEVRTLSVAARPKYQNRVKSYQAELSRLRKEFQRARIAFCDELKSREELLSNDDNYGGDDQKQRLLDNTERMERSTKLLKGGYKLALETEKVGAAILTDLSAQRETITRAREKSCHKREMPPELTWGTLASETAHTSVVGRSGVYYMVLTNSAVPATGLLKQLEEARHQELAALLDKLASLMPQWLRTKLVEYKVRKQQCLREFAAQVKDELINWYTKCCVPKRQVYFDDNDDSEGVSEEHQARQERAAQIFMPTRLSSPSQCAMRLCGASWRAGEACRTQLA
ncbi:hypothetical protein HPB49_004508 [Dermacentor silvarum]|uniref:Uncharacterized protein n=1 Tax=Dermacentor silvarum TaxID=543639 RepID=A0ACB8DUR4_DERSI|nr:hypothetical protein HPB49_004508 [Dermacentor silvarum]